AQDVALDRGPAGERLNAPAPSAAAARPVDQHDDVADLARAVVRAAQQLAVEDDPPADAGSREDPDHRAIARRRADGGLAVCPGVDVVLDRKSTRLNSSHVKISYAVFFLIKK